MKKLLAILMMAAALSSIIIPINAETSLAIYVCDGGGGDGTSPSSPTDTLEKAYELILDRSNIKDDPSEAAVIVICGKLTVADHFNYDGKISHKGKVIFTSSYGGNDYRKTSDARLIIHAESKESLSIYDEHRFLLGGPTRFEDLTLDRGGKTNASLTIYTGTNFFASEDFKVVNTNWSLEHIPAVRALSPDEIDSIILSAHRGFQPEGPENSLLSFEAAGRHGFDYIETDVLETADGELVCIHDPTLDRTTNGSGKVNAMTYEEILKYRIDVASYGFDISSADQSKLYVPTFREYLEICKEYGSKPFIELKTGDKSFIKKVIDMALEYFAPEDIVISSSSLSLLQMSYDIDHDVFCHLIWGDQTDAGYENSIKALSRMVNSKGTVNAGIAFNIQKLSVPLNFERAKLWIDKAKAASLLTCLRAADDMNEIRRMLELGIDYYPTNTTSPEKLHELAIGKDSENVLSPADGGKLFIRGGRRSESTEQGVAITLLGGIFDFVAPSNAEAPSIGSYRIAVGGNAFISRLVMGETCKEGTDNESSALTVADHAMIKELYAAGDYANTHSITIEINGGNVDRLIHSRGKGGTAVDLQLILADVELLPQSIDISNSAIITGQKALTVYAQAPADATVWDSITVIPADTKPTDETSAVPETEIHAEFTQAVVDPSRGKRPPLFSVAVATAVILTAVILFIIIKKGILCVRKK